MSSFYEQLRQIPFVRLAIALLAGIIWQGSVWQFKFSTVFIVALLAILFLILFFVPYFKTYSRQWFPGVVGLLCVFFVGTTIAQQQQTDTSLPLGEELWLQAEICDAPLSYEKYFKLQAIVKKCATESDTVAVNEKIIIYAARTANDEQPKAGETIYAKANLSLIPPPGNPEEFNYQQFLARKHIFASTFIPQGNYTVDQHRGWWQKIRYLPVHWQQSALRVFENSPLGDKEMAVMVALSLGTKQYLDDEIRTSYVSAGAMHLLAVSGLHVGIIMGLLSFLFKPLTRRKNGIVYRNIFIIICLWTYAAIVGFSPSVTRATVMFSFVLIGETMKRKISIYNSLAASAFFICLFNPLVVFEAGFQLSYCAVLSIVYFQPHIAGLLYVKNKFLNGIWQLATVSLAAQIGTLPISLLNFHLFPNYFLLTNISVITLTGFIVGGGAAYLAVHAIPVVSTIVGYVLHAMLWLLNHIVQFVEALPYSVTQNIYLYRWQAIVLAALILCVAIYLYSNRRVWLWAAAYALVAVIGGWEFQHLAHREQQMMTVYKVKNSSYIQFVNGNKALTVRDKQHSSENFLFNVSNFQIKQGFASNPAIIETEAVKGDTTIRQVCCYHSFIIFGNELYKILDDEYIAQHLPLTPLDYLIITGVVRTKPEIVLQHYLPKQLILDSSVSTYRAQQWIAAAESNNINLHNVRNDGAFVHRIK